MTTIKEMTKRYQTDATFHQVVRALEDIIETMKLTPSEVRDAATFAAYLVELRSPQSLWPKSPSPAKE